MSVEQRAAERVPCELPLRVLAEIEPVPGAVRDLSRTGLRFRADGRHFGVHRLASLVNVARRVTEHFGNPFVVVLEGASGAEVRKTLKLVRIGQRDWESTEVEIGCTLEPAVTDTEAARLGVELPALQVPATAAAEEADATDGAEAVSPLDVELHPSSDRNTAPFSARVEEVGADEVVIRVEDLGALGLDEVQDVSGLVVAFDAAFGSNVAVRITDGTRHIWTGPGTIRSVELIDSTPPQALIGVGLRRALRAHELQELGAA